MMFNVLYSVYPLFLWVLSSFFVLLTIRYLFIKRTIIVLLYHISLFFILFIAVLGGGGVLNDDYDRLEKFILLEKNNELPLAKKNPHHYDPTLRIDLQEFKNSNEFRAYVKRHDICVDRAEAIFIGWMFVFLSEISMVFVRFIHYVCSLIKK